MNATKVVVMHRGGLAFYVVALNGEGRYHAHLNRYDGRTKDAPPPDVLLFQKDNKWLADGEDEHLVQELGRIIEQKLLNRSSMINR